MNIKVIENDLSSYSTLSGYESFSFVKAFYSEGSFALKINANHPSAKYLSTDKIISVHEKLEYQDSKRNVREIPIDFDGYIDKITIDRKSDSAGEYVIAEGVELKDAINRVIYPDSGLDNISFTNEYLETIIKTLIQKNASGTEVIAGVGTASASRQIPNLKVAPAQSRGLQIDYSARYKDLSKEIYSLLASQNMGLKADLDPVNKTIIFDVVVGNDLRTVEGQAGGIKLSLDTKTALEITDTEDRLSYKNLSVTAGLGEGADRTIQEVYVDETEPTGWLKREVFTDARDIESDDELPTRGALKLADLSRTRAVSCKVNSLGSYSIGNDYTLGDFISIDTTAGLYDGQVIKLKYRLQKDSIPFIDASINYDTEDALIADIKARHMDYDALVAASSVNGSIVDKHVFTSAGSSHTFSGLDIVTDGGIYEIFISTYSPADIRMRINGDTVDTNYGYQYVNSYNAVVNAGNGNDSKILLSTASSRYSLIKGQLSLTDENGSKYPQGHFTTAMQSSVSPTQMFVSWRKYAITVNINSITISTVTGLFSKGTKMFICKRR